MLKKLGGFGFLLLLLTIPLQAEHRHRGYYEQRRYSPGFIQFQIGTPYGGGFFVQSYRPAPRYYAPRYYNRYDRYDRYDRYERRYREAKRRWYKRHRHFHYNNRCPY